MEYPVRGRKVKIKVCLNRIFNKHPAETLVASKLYSLCIEEQREEIISKIHKELRKKVEKLIINDLDELGKIAFEMELYREEDEYQKRDYINIRSKNYKKPTVGEILDDLEVYEEILDWTELHHQSKKNLPVEVKNSTEVNTRNYLNSILVKERNHTTDITKNDNFRSKSKIIKNLNVFLIKRHLNEFLKYHKVKEENMIETELTVEIEYLNDNFRIERENAENMEIFYKNFEENGMFNKKEPPDKETSLEKENEGLKGIEVIQKKPRNAKRKKARNQCSIEEQRKKDRKRFKPPDTGWFR